MLTDNQIEELGWAKVQFRNFFLFESNDDNYRNWEMRIDVTPGEFTIFPVMSNGDGGASVYHGEIDDQMELYDIMVDVGILPKED